LQLLEIPVLDLTGSSPSHRRYGRGYLLTRAELLAGYALYLPDADRRREPYASPLFARDLSGLPPTMVITAQFDPLRDEGEEYARRLAAAGVAVEHVMARGHVHSSMYTPMRSAQRYQRLAADALRHAYRTASG
jgi:acetyl esterase